MTFINKVLFSIIFLFIICVSVKTCVDPDLWGHIKFGLDSLEQGQLLSNDIYSYSASGGKWINHEWLSEFIFAYLYKYSGVYGLVVFRLIIGLLIAFFLFKIISSQTKFIFEKLLIFVPLFTLLSSYACMIRPQVFSYLFASIYVYLFYKISLNKNAAVKQMIPLAVIMLFWVNLHGGFLSGLGLFSLFIIGNTLDKKKLNFKLFSVFVLTILITLINPYMLDLHIFLYRSLKASRSITEWSFLGLDNTMQWAFIGFVFLLLVLSQKKKTFTDIFFIFIPVYLGLKHIKLFPFFLIPCAMVLPPFLEDLLRNQYKLLPKQPVRMLKKAGVTVFTGFVLLSAVLLLEIIINFTHSFYGLPNSYPVKAINYIQDSEIRGNVLSYFDWGEYCIWHLYPDCKVFFDGRFRTVYEPEIEDTYFDYHFARKGWDKALEDFPTEIILWKTDSPLVKLMGVKNNWKMIYTDETAVIFVNTNSGKYKSLSLTLDNELRENKEQRLFP